MAGVALIAFLAAICGLVASTQWFYASRALDRHGAMDGRFKSRFSHAATATALFLGLSSIAALLGLYVSGF